MHDDDNIFKYYLSIVLQIIWLNYKLFINTFFNNDNIYLNYIRSIIKFISLIFLKNLKINMIGDKIKIDTRKGAYSERVKS
mgnify:CR=1 FL=1